LIYIKEFEKIAEKGPEAAGIAASPA